MIFNLFLINKVIKDQLKQAFHFAIAIEILYIYSQNQKYRLSKNLSLLLYQPNMYF